MASGEGDEAVLAINGVPRPAAGAALDEMPYMRVENCGSASGGTELQTDARDVKQPECAAAGKHIGGRACRQLDIVDMGIANHFLGEHEHVALTCDARRLALASGERILLLRQLEGAGGRQPDTWEEEKEVGQRKSHAAGTLLKGSAVSGQNGKWGRHEESVAASMGWRIGRTGEQVETENNIARQGSGRGIAARYQRREAC
eukprot:6204800-Pleurochrysis_carterae.AAC.3